jgi:hypothetical protein
MQWENGVEDALRKVAERSDDGWIVTLVGHPLLLFGNPSSRVAGNHRCQSWYYRFTKIRGLQTFGSGFQTSSQITLLHFLLVPNTCPNSLCIRFIDLQHLFVSRYVPS